MFNAVGQQIAHHPDHQDGSAHVLRPDVDYQSGSLARTALSTKRVSRTKLFNGCSIDSGFV